MSDEGRTYAKKHSPFTGNTFWVHYVLGDLANKQHDYEIFIGDARLASEWPFSARAIERARAELVAAGYLTILDDRSGPGRQIRYRFEFLDAENTRQSGDRSTPANLAENTRQSGGEHPPKGEVAPLTNRRGTEENKSAFADEFAIAWKGYPRKLEKAKALKAYTARRRAGVSADELLAATQNYAGAVRCTEVGFIKHGATFYGPDEPFRDYIDGIPNASRRSEHASSNQQTIDAALARIGHPTADPAAGPGHDAIEATATVMDGAR